MYYTFEEIVSIYRSYIPLDDNSLKMDTYTDSDDAEFMVNDVYLYLKDILLKIDVYLYKKDDKYIISMDYLDYLDIENIEMYNNLPNNVYTLRRN